MLVGKTTQGEEERQERIKKEREEGDEEGRREGGRKGERKREGEDFKWRNDMHSNTEEE